MLNTPLIRTLLGVVAAIAIAAGLFLVGNYNLSSPYASDVPTATQTVKMCHNSCSYLAPDIAFRLKLGMGLFVAGGLCLVVMQMWSRFAPSFSASSAFRPQGLRGVAMAITAFVSGSAFACWFAVLPSQDSVRENAPVPPPGYEPAAHHGLSYANAVSETLAHLVLPVWGTLAVCTVIGLFLRGARRKLDRNDLPLMVSQIAGIAVTAIVLMTCGNAIVAALVDSPFGPH